VPVVTPWVLLAVPSYVIGSFPTAQIVGRRFGADVTNQGSGNPGASNTFRVAGKKAGVIVFVVDICKGLVPTVAGLLVSGRPVAMVCGVAAVAGHTLPVTRRFRGGKGVATAGGLGFGLYPLHSTALIVLWFVVAKLTHKASIASLFVVVGLPVAVAVTGHRAWETICISVLGVFIVFRHKDNLKRLMAHSEASLNKRPKSTDS
jgi:glycerol-3-phosphate acyltransferase PlsY